jgi:hypothetical protein
MRAALPNPVRRNSCESNQDHRVPKAGLHISLNLGAPEVGLQIAPSLGAAPKTGLCGAPKVVLCGAPKVGLHVALELGALELG